MNRTIKIILCIICIIAASIGIGYIQGLKQNDKLVDRLMENNAELMAEVERLTNEIEERSMRGGLDSFELREICQGIMEED